MVQTERIYPIHGDERGIFQELARKDNGNLMVTFDMQQMSWFTINPGFTRGNHLHLETVEIFLCLEGSVLFISEDKFGRTTEVSMQVGDMVRVPPWNKHKFSNVSSSLAKVLVLSNRCFDPDDPDTFVDFKDAERYNAIERITP